MKPEDQPDELALIEAATEVFDRLAEELGADGARDSDVASVAPAAAGGLAAGRTDPIGEQQLRAAAARTIDLFAGLFQQTFETYVELAQSLIQRSVAGGNASPSTAGQLEFGGSPGTVAAATVWIHNTTDAPEAAVALRLTDLSSPSGARIAAASAQLIPTVVDVPPNGSASALVSLAIPLDAQAGDYFGHVLAIGLPSALPVRVAVDEGPPR